MLDSATPDAASCRAERRRRAGVHSAWIWGGAAIVLLVIYLAAYTCTLHFSNMRWRKAIQSALRERNAEKVSALLIACRRESPQLAETPEFTLWQKELLNLQQANAYRRKMFQQKFQALQKLLSTGNDQGEALTAALIDAAGYASDEEDLARLRSLQKHCETLMRKNMLAAAQQAVMALDKLRSKCESLPELRRQKNWNAHRNLLTTLQKSAEALAAKFQALPEIASAVEKTQKILAQESALANDMQNVFRREDAAYNAVFTQQNAADIAAAAKSFLQNHPQSRHNAVLKKLLSDLALLDRPYKDELQKQLDDMEKNLAGARKLFARELEQITAKELESGSFELILKSGFNEYFHFETLDDARFSEFDKDNICHIRFTLIDGRKLYAEFTANGTGKIMLDGNLFAGTMANGSPRGKLPVSYKQKLLLKLGTMCRSGREKDFPELLYVVQQDLDLNKLIPDTLRAKLLQALRRTEAVLGCRAGEFIFCRSILLRCQQLVPQFAGLAISAGAKSVKYCSDGREYRRSTVWAVNSSPQAPEIYSILGFIEKRSLQGHTTELLAQQPVTVLAVPADAVDITAEIAQWRKLGAKDEHFRKFPILPEFLAGFNRKK